MEVCSLYFLFYALYAAFQWAVGSVSEVKALVRNAASSCDLVPLGSLEHPPPSRWAPVPQEHAMNVFICVIAYVLYGTSDGVYADSV